MYAGLMIKEWHFFHKYFIEYSFLAIWSDIPIYFSEEVEFRWAGNKLFLPGDVNKPVGKVYNTYLTGDMACFYSAPAPATKKAAGFQPQLLMVLELYVDQPKVLIQVIPQSDNKIWPIYSLSLIQFMLWQRNTNQGTSGFGQPSATGNITTMLRKQSATATELDNPLLKCHVILNSG